MWGDSRIPPADGGPLPPVALVLLGGAKQEPLLAPTPPLPAPQLGFSCSPGFWPRQRAVDPKTPLRSSSRVVVPH